MNAHIEVFAASFAALYAAHHIGDYWLQKHSDAMGKGKPGKEGRGHCIRHVTTYVATQMVCFGVMAMVTRMEFSFALFALAMLVSGVTHYMADRREYGLMFKLAQKIGKGDFMKLGAPRAGIEIPQYPNEGRPQFVGDNPQLATGLWSLDQSWHIFWGVFVAALIISI